MSNLLFCIAGIAIGLIFFVAGIFQAFAPAVWADLPIHGKGLIVDRQKTRREMMRPTARVLGGGLFMLFGLFITVECGIQAVHWLVVFRK
ncbi:hypothetical protein [Terriglobus roseus]|uniref:Uncharacterized protein n=1 Tax=Terriglobus roseus TaxID=392734 RepID=A0A1G7LBN3_9BACT|nr:hypothetical protein [Terriglobus roseus]SDF46811.1 hypothetical protein SAMN05444167_2488 [Terriglobus roseus]